MFGTSESLLLFLTLTIAIHHHYHVEAFLNVGLQRCDSDCTFSISSGSPLHNLPTSPCYYANDNEDANWPKGSTTTRSRCRRCNRNSLLLKSSPSDVEDSDDISFTTAADNDVGQAKTTANNDDTHRNINELKMELLQYGASYDRGFGATPRVRSTVSTLIQDLESFNTEDNAASYVDNNSAPSSSSSSALVGNWRLIWATGQDVLSLAASPFVTVGAIYQVFTEPPIVTNVIDILPRAQALLPPSIIPNSILRLNVQTRASKTSGNANTNRIGLDFESVKIEPIEFLGQDVSKVLPPLGFGIPRITSGVTGYFDVSYLDKDLVIIKQTALSSSGVDGAGLFVLTKVDNTDP